MANVYFDHNSTTTIRPEVLSAMLPFMQSQHGNPTSRHVFGRNARDAVEAARAQVAKAVGVQASQVVFTSGGTEANNFAVHGITAGSARNGFDKGQILTSAVEHPCVSKPALALQAHGWVAKSIPVDESCRVKIDALEALLHVSSSLVSVMLANNETGAMQDIAQIVTLARTQKVAVHTDAVQALGKMDVDFNALGVQAMTISSHKIGGPQGAGALVLDKRVDIEPLLYGGGQERGLRSGTENVAAIVGFGAACELAISGLQSYREKTAALQAKLDADLRAMGANIFAADANRLPNTTFFAFPHIEGETLVTALDKAGFAVASGSACSSNSGEPSHVLLAMGVTEDLARGAVRVSFGSNNTAQEVDGFLITLQQEVARLKQYSAIAA
jgi:cysteine desulfurase